MADLVGVFRASIEDRSDLTEKSRKVRQGTLRTLLKTRQGLEELSPGAISRPEVEQWRNRVARDGTGHVNHNAKGPNAKLTGRSASNVNKVIDALRAILDIAVEQGQISSNPIAARGMKLRMNSRKPNLPDSPTLAAIFSRIEKQSRETGDFCRFLAYTGCRLEEARGVTWADVDLGPALSPCRNEDRRRRENRPDQPRSANHQCRRL